MDASIHWPAVIVSGIVYFLIGWAWYSPVLFCKAWIKASGIDTGYPVVGYVVMSIILVLWK